MCKKMGIFLSLFLLLPVVHLSQVPSVCGSDSTSAKTQDNLVLYKITLNTYWTRIKFPKYYPNDRAQFGKIFGQTHDKTYSLYRLGTRLNSGLVHYIETGEIHGITSEGSNRNVLDSFIGSSIFRGHGTSTTQAFFDNNHTLVSIISRLNPSPDWFIGLDSFQLCIDGDWIDTVTVELKQYNLANVYHEDEAEMEFVSIEKASSRYSPANELMDNTENGTHVVEKTAASDHQKYGYWPNNSNQYTIGNDKQENNKAAIIDGIVSFYHKFPMRKYKHSERLKKAFGVGDVKRPIQSNKPNKSNNIDSPLSRPTSSLILSNSRVNQQLHMKNREIQWKGNLHRQRPLRDCKSSDWSAWSACSRSCGVGETQRVRKIIVKARRGGKPCHPLKETKWCGSVTPCPNINKQIDHFYIN
ncbi:uncharacterized protein LOC135163864 isoform X3 [Diachasmimorpha longicaudata]|uniref:uncharacterized protein LOC135163864 isoform X3 n=1 Tax=Diachasmimorpha longicaudata TaxID=58733 RepID=UPI0030B8ED1A